MHHLRLAVRLAFFAGLIVVLFLTLYPAPSLNPAPAADKGEHLIAFLVLFALGRLGWPSARWGIAFALVAVGGGIEVLQGNSFIARDMSLLDWVADSVGVLAGTLAAAAATTWWQRSRIADDLA